MFLIISLMSVVSLNDLILYIKKRWIYILFFNHSIHTLFLHKISASFMKRKDFMFYIKSIELKRHERMAFMMAWVMWVNMVRI